MSALIIVVVAGLVALGLVRWLIHPDAPIRILDHPNERSLHTIPRPRTGGLAICTALLAAWACSLFFPQADMFPLQILSGAVLVAGVSILDDRYGLLQGLRLLVHVGAALLLIRGGFIIQGDLLPGLSLTSGLVASIVTVLATLWLINLYNFMDGMDGLAGGMAVIGFGTLAVLGWLHGDNLYSVAALTVAAAAAGFLWFNFPPARIFMGDTGSTTLGFLAAGFAVWASYRSVAPAWLSVVVFSPFIVDATATLIQRALRGEVVWHAHRSHYYQRAVQAGWSHGRTVLVEYGMMLICAVSALVMVGLEASMQWLILACLSCLYVGAVMAVRTLEHKTRC
jgi:UDP-N-acetylmuramyl pentapeptide phosphotransferase/UDP-N-acetylglucosamine-1-phosphate transferase